MRRSTYSNQLWPQSPTKGGTAASAVRPSAARRLSPRHRSASFVIPSESRANPMTLVAAPPVTRLTTYINGQWPDSQASEWRDVINPATGEILAQVPMAEAAEVNQAIEAAAPAFPEGRRTPPEDRIQPL